MMPQSWVGKSIGGRYQIDALLGQGGMSAVYRATDPNLRRMIAVKLIHPHLSVDPNFVNRFKEEAAAVARLRHPNIVQVHDFNNDGETYYMVMEYLMGETLQARLKRLNAVQRHMPYTEVIRLCYQLCDAIGYAHKHELIHRDIKPANIMLDVNGQAILMDFGIVKIIGGEYHTATGATIGTAMYMSPEQIRSERVDERSDIYSLGVTLYEMISGRTPYQADSALTLMMMVLNDPLPDLRDFRKGVPEALLAVVEKALAKENKDRFQTMEEMAAALEQAQKEIPEIVPPATQIDSEQAENARAPEASTESPEEVEDTPAKPTPAEILPGGALREETADPVLIKEKPKISSLPTLRDEPRKPAPTPRPTTAAKARDIARPKPRAFTVAAAVVLLLGAAITFGLLFFRTQQAPGTQISPVNQPLGPINSETAEFVVNLGRWVTGSFIEELAYSPDGKRIGTANNRDTLRFARYQFYGGLWPVDSGNLPNYLLGHTRWIYSAAFSPDGQFFATASDEGKVLLWQVMDGSLSRTIEASIGGLSSVDFSPNNLLLAVGSWEGKVGLWQLSDGHLLRTLEAHENSSRDVEFSPDGTLLATASDDQTISLWQVSTGSLARILRGHTAPVLEVAFSPDGSLLASASEDHTVGLWQMSDGSLVKRLQGHAEAVSSIAFSADGSLLVSGSVDGTLRLWRVADGEILSILTGHNESITSIAFSPDNHILVSSSTDGVLRFWGLTEALQLEIETPEPLPPTQSPSPGI